MHITMQNDDDVRLLAIMQQCSVCIIDWLNESQCGCGRSSDPGRYLVLAVGYV